MEETKTAPPPRFPLAPPPPPFPLAPLPPPQKKKKQQKQIGTTPRSPLAVRLSFYALAFLFAIPYGALNSINQTSQAVFGGAPGASTAAVSLADELSRTANVALSASWLVFLFFVPALLEWTRGARNAFAVMMFAWTGAGAMLVGAFALSLRETTETSPATRSGMQAFSILFGLLVGVFGGLGYTATEVYLDTCAEWMPLALDAADDKNKAKEEQQLATAATPKEAEAEAAASSLPPPAGEPFSSPAELAAETALRHKFIASRYKNLFASHIYAFVEVGTVAFTLPGALGLVDGPKMIRLLVAVTCCLLAGAIASLFIPDLQDPSEREGRGEEEGGEENEEATSSTKKKPPVASSCLSGLSTAVVGAARSALASITCLSAYNGLAALAVVPYFFSAAYADNYFQFVVLGTQCGLRSKPTGIGLEGANIMALFGSAVQAAAAFAGPAMVGPRKLQFKEHVAPLALGNLCGAAGALLVAGLGGLRSKLCGSLPLMLTTKMLSSIAFGVNNSVGVAAVLCWYSGERYQRLVVAALASRSVWTQLGGIVGPFTFGDSFATLQGGKPAALFAAAVYAMGSLCVVAAHLINEATQRRGAAKRVEEARAAAAAAAAAAAGVEGEEAAFVLSEAELRLAAQEGRMTAGFSDSPSAAAWRESVVAGSSLRRRKRRSQSQQPREVV